MNDFVHRAFVKAGVPAVKEPTGLLRADGKYGLMAELGSRLTGVSGDRREALFLYQRLSVINQRFNAVAIRGCMAQDDD